MWSFAASQNGKLLHKSAVARLDLEHPPTHISITPGSSSSNFHVVVVTRNGDLRVFECSTASDGSLSATKWAASRNNNAVLNAVGTGGDAQGASLVIASGSAVKPTVDIVRVVKESSGAVAVVEVSGAEVKNFVFVFKGFINFNID